MALSLAACGLSSGDAPEPAEGELTGIAHAGGSDILPLSVLSSQRPIDDRQVVAVPISGFERLKAHPDLPADSDADAAAYLRGMALLCIDAMNVIGSRPDGWWRDRDAAVGRLVDELQPYAAGTTADVLVVVDGRPIPGLEEGDHGAIEVCYATRPGPDAADDRIVEFIRATDDLEVEVVTADRDLRARVGALGATSTGPRQLLHQLSRYPEGTRTASDQREDRGGT
ncbi:MAG: NYN domain-containing protein [Nitriliruptoraceae bacterium]